MLSDAQAKHFYNSKEWKRKRAEVLRKNNYQCQSCLRRLQEAAQQGIQLSECDRRIRRATQVHHKHELKKFPELALADDNLEALCGVCHNDEHGRYVTGYRRKRTRRPVTKEMW